MSRMGFPSQYRCASLNITHTAVEISSDVCRFTAMETREKSHPKLSTTSFIMGAAIMSRQPKNVTTQSLPTLMFAQVTTYTDNVKFPHCNTQLYLRILLKDIEQISRSFWQTSDGDCIVVLNDKGARSSCSGTGTECTYTYRLSNLDMGNRGSR